MRKKFIKGKKKEEAKNSIEQEKMGKRKGTSEMNKK